MTEMPSVDANGVTTEYDVRGEGEPILFVMGLGGQLIDWNDGLIDLFVEAGYQAICFDNRDIGLSTQSTWEPPSQAKMIAAHITRRTIKGVGYTLGDMADDAAGLLEQLGVESAHVVGMSMGGMIAQELAIAHPARVKSLCSIMSNTGDRRNGRISAKAAAKFGRMKPPTLDNAVDTLVKTFEIIAGPHFDPEEYRTLAKASTERSFAPEGVLRQAAAVAGSRDRTPFLGSVTAPTLVVHGLVDPLVMPSGGVATANAIPGSRLLAFGDMGHDLPRPRWVEMSRAILRNAQRTH